MRHLTKNDAIDIDSECIEHLIEKTKTSYHECLQESSLNRHEEEIHYGSVAGNKGDAKVFGKLVNPDVRVEIKL